MEPEQGKEVGKVNETLCLHPFVISEGLTAVLLVQQGVQSPVDSLRKRQTIEVGRKLDVDVNGGLPAHFSEQFSIVRR